MYSDALSVYSNLMTVPEGVGLVLTHLELIENNFNWMDGDMLKKVIRNYLKKNAFIEEADELPIEILYENEEIDQELNYYIYQQDMKPVLAFIQIAPLRSEHSSSYRPIVFVLSSMLPIEDWSVANP